MELALLIESREGTKSLCIETDAGVETQRICASGNFRILCAIFKEENKNCILLKVTFYLMLLPKCVLVLHFCPILQLMMHGSLNA